MKRRDSSEEDSRQRHRRLALKRRRASEDDDSDDDSDESSEEDRPVRKRVNRIDSDDDEEEAEEKPKEKKAAEEDSSVLSKGTNSLPPTNGQSTVKSVDGVVRPTPAPVSHVDPSKPVAPNGLGSQEVPAQEEDEDDLLGVTDLVDYVCNNEDL